MGALAFVVVRMVTAFVAKRREGALRLEDDERSMGDLLDEDEKKEVVVEEDVEVAKE